MSWRRLALAGAALSAILAAAPALAAPAAPALGTDVTRTALILTLLAVVPAVLVSMTSFIRIVIVLSMVRHAFGMPETPPNAVLVSLSLFLTAFTMGPTLTTLNTAADQPLLAGRIAPQQAMEAGRKPLRDFMLAQTRDADIESIYALSNTPLPDRPEDVELLKLAPAFILNELRVAFTIGFIILLPFLLIDLVVSTTLLSMGMLQLPPAMVSLPFKVLLFVMIDGWNLIVGSLVRSFG